MEGPHSVPLLRGFDLVFSFELKFRQYTDTSDFMFKLFHVSAHVFSCYLNVISYVFTRSTA